MRKLVIALAAVLIAGLGALAPAGAAPARAASVNPKVAIIVGATGSVTASYRTAADQLYAEAIKYTTNVVKVYSPNATWSRVRAAVNGASIIVYLGHGNGWPAPYPNDATYSQKDGFGLNYDTNGDGRTTDSELRYYGEPSIRTLTPAPNAVVLLFHLCYASGNSEPGLAEPTLSVARQRADNYAAAFQAMGARAVIAIGHSHDPYYIRALFTMRESIRDYWTNAPGFHNHVISFASSRTPGATELLDPDYGGAVRVLALAHRQHGPADRGRHRRELRVHRRRPGVDGPCPATRRPPPTARRCTGRSPTRSRARTRRPRSTAATIVRVDAKETVTTAVGASPIYRVHTDGGVTGWMTGSTLTPRDSVAPRVWVVAGRCRRRSRPTATATATPSRSSIRLSETTHLDAAHPRRRRDAARVRERHVRHGRASRGRRRPAPSRTAPTAWRLTATDAYGNGPLAATGAFTVDTVPPALAVAGDPAPSRLFTPNGDGVGDTIVVRGHIDRGRRQRGHRSAAPAARLSTSAAVPLAQRRRDRHVGRAHDRGRRRARRHVRACSSRSATSPATPAPW